jgi:hypothetical protein
MVAEGSIATLSCLQSLNDNLSRELSNMSWVAILMFHISGVHCDFSLTSEEGLLRFQAGNLSDNDAQWHRLVPPEAQEALGKREVERQSVLFEVFLAERDYVFDLKMVKEVASVSALSLPSNTV